ncbi:MAG: hypothetical protein IPL06_02910 [Betaproteobacteria bacterium]|nr:hypothetical protein [Betaproteobacteria bacterium]
MMPVTVPPDPPPGGQVPILPVAMSMQSPEPATGSAVRPGRVTVPSSATRRRGVFPAAFVIVTPPDAGGAMTMSAARADAGRQSAVKMAIRTRGRGVMAVSRAIAIAITAPACA